EANIDHSDVWRYLAAVLQHPGKARHDHRVRSGNTAVEHFHAVELGGGRDANDSDRVILRGDQTGEMCSMAAIILAGGAWREGVEGRGCGVGSGCKIRMGEVGARVEESDTDPRAIR